jgi:hypothetical protein
VRLGLLGLATGAGVGLGLAAQPGPTADGRGFLGQVAVATKDAGSARFTFSSVTRSSNRYLASTQTGSGIVSFRSDAGEVSEVNHSTSYSQSGSGPPTVGQTTSVVREVKQGRTVYLDLGAGSLPDDVARWVVERNLPVWLSGAFDLSGLDVLENTLQPDPSLLVAVAPVGSPVVRGTPTTEYAVTTMSTCQAPLARAGPRMTTGPTRVWVDAQGRLVRLQTTTHLVTPPSGTAPASFAGRSTTVDTLGLRDFGAAVTIHPPAPDQLAHANVRALNFAPLTPCA